MVFIKKMELYMVQIKEYILMVLFKVIIQVTVMVF